MTTNLVNIQINTLPIFQKSEIFSDAMDELGLVVVNRSQSSITVRIAPRLWGAHWRNDADSLEIVNL